MHQRVSSAVLWVGRDVKVYIVPTPCPRQGTFQLAQVDHGAAVKVINSITDSVKGVFVFSCSA